MSPTAIKKKEVLRCNPRSWDRVASMVDVFRQGQEVSVRQFVVQYEEANFTSESRNPVVGSKKFIQIVRRICTGPVKNDMGAHPMNCKSKS